jgi:hypothetical protein
MDVSGGSPPWRCHQVFGEELPEGTGLEGIEQGQPARMPGRIRSNEQLAGQGVAWWADHAPNWVRQPVREPALPARADLPDAAPAGCFRS